CSRKEDVEPVLCPPRTRPAPRPAHHNHAVPLPPSPIPGKRHYNSDRNAVSRSRSRACATERGRGTFHGWNDAESAVLLAIAPGRARRMPAEKLGGLSARCLPDPGERRPPPERLPVRETAHDPGDMRNGTALR